MLSRKIMLLGIFPSGHSRRTGHMSGSDRPLKHRCHVLSRAAIMLSPVTSLRRLPAPAARRAQFTGRPGQLLTLCLAAALIIPGLARADTDDIAGICRQASWSFLDQAQGGLQTHMAQIRTRQKHLSRAYSRDVPRFQNQLQLSDRTGGNIPLASSPVLKSGSVRLANSAPGKTNVYVRGTLYSINNSSGLGLTTPGTVIGSDQQVNEEVAIGFAAGRIATRKASGTVLSAYLSLQPAQALMLDMSFSLGMHRARRAFLLGYGDHGLGIAGMSQAISLELNHQPEVFYGWSFSPYSRYDLMSTRLDASPLDARGWHANRSRASLSFGSVIEADGLGGLLGPVQPRLQVELQHQVTDGNGHIKERYKTHGMIGLGLTSRLSHDMATFAESRYAAESGSASPESLLLLGVRLFF